MKNIFQTLLLLSFVAAIFGGSGLAGSLIATSLFDKSWYPVISMYGLSVIAIFMYAAIIYKMAKRKYDAEEQEKNRQA